METAKIDRNRCLDLIKFISAFMVVFIHIKFRGEFGDIVTALARFAVPLFFMVSGFFTYKISAKKIRNRMLKLFLLYLIASVIYHSWAILAAIKDLGINGLFLYIKSAFTLYNLVCFLLFNMPFSSSHLWFLLALIYIYAIWRLVVKLGDKFVLFLSCFCLAEDTLASSVSISSIKSDILPLTSSASKGSAFTSAGASCAFTAAQ